MPVPAPFRWMTFLVYAEIFARKPATEFLKVRSSSTFTRYFTLFSDEARSYISHTTPSDCDQGNTPVVGATLTSCQRLGSVFDAVLGLVPSSKSLMPNPLVVSIA